jgi:hypothetical protein
MEPFEALELVNDQTTFLEFVRVLAADRAEGQRLLEAGGGVGFKMPDGTRLIDCDDNGWRNFTIADFLDASVAWAEASEFGARQGISQNPWRQFATFLYCGKIYE